MAFCLPKGLVENFKNLVRENDPGKLIQMSTEERHKLFETISDPRTAKEINTAFEKKVVMVNKKLAMENWVKQLTGVTPEVKRDLITKIGKMDDILNPASEKAFLQDLAESKLKVGVTANEAAHISQAVKEIETAKVAIPDNSPVGSKERLDYGLKQVLFQDYMGKLKLEANKPSLKSYLNPFKSLQTISGFTKSAVASLDNSFQLRQGIKMLYTNPDIWLKNFIKSWGTIGKQLFAKGNGLFKGTDDAVMNAIKADVFSRPNAISGKYKTAGIDIGLGSEEAFPTSLPERIPLFGRLFKASEAAYNGTALRMRADYADRVINAAEKMGKNMTDPVEAKGVGNLINSMTGRGNIGKAEVLGKEINATFFSIKFLKSNFDTVTAHLLDKAADPFVRKQAAGNLLKIIGVQAAILTGASTLWPGSVEFDPRSADFGKIKIRGRKFDISGGMNSLISIAARLVVPTEHNGEWGLWNKNSRTGEWTKLTSNKFGAQNAMDVFDSFWQGKLSPLAGTIRDIWKGQNYQGLTVTPQSAVENMVTPITIQNYLSLKDANTADKLTALILDSLGLNVSIPNSSQGKLQQMFKGVKFSDSLIREYDRLNQTATKPTVSDITESSSSWADLKSKLSASAYAKAQQDYVSRWASASAKLIESASYKKASDKEKSELLNKVRQYASSQALTDSGYKKGKTPTPNKALNNFLKGLVK